MDFRVPTSIKGLADPVDQKKYAPGEVAVGFGLRHQAVADQKDGMPILAIDPVEGNYALTESVAVIDKKGENQPARHGNGRMHRQICAGRITRDLSEPTLRG